MIDFTLTVRPDKRRIDKLVEDLEYVSRNSFVRSLPLAEYREQALAYLKRQFPVSQNGSTNQIEFGYHLVEGWKSELVQSVTGVGFRIYHKGENIPRLALILRALDQGSRPFSYVAKDDFTFWGRYVNARGKLGRKQGWVTITEGRTVARGAREGSAYAEKTSDYIEDVLLPRMRDMVRERVKARMER